MALDMSFHLLTNSCSRFKTRIGLVCCFVTIFILFAIYCNIVPGLFYRDTKPAMADHDVFVYSEQALDSVLTGIHLHHARSLYNGGYKFKQHELCITKQEGAGCNKELPSCIVIGTYKSGTREFVDFLSMHPQVVVRKRPFYEVSYFDGHPDQSLEWYRNNMPPRLTGQLTIEKSPGYFVSKRTPRAIFEMDPNIKLILMVREPVSRTISHFYFRSSVAKGQYGGSLSNCIYRPGTLKVNRNCIFVKHSLYAEHFKRYLEYFKRDQISVIDADEFAGNPFKILKKVERYLNLPNFIHQDRFMYNKKTGYYCIRASPTNTTAVCYGKDRGKRFQTGTTFYRNETENLTAFYRPLNEEFFQLLGKKLPW